MQITEFLSLLEGVKGSGNQYIAKCPAHDDRRQSLSVSIGKDGRILAKCHAGCSIHAIAGAIGITTKDLFPAPGNKPDQQRQLVATYNYVDEAGQLVYQKLRYSNKSFSQRRPDGNGGWVYNLKGVTPVLYNLPAVMQSKEVFIVEGEKDCETLRTYGKTATCGTHGAGPGKWLSHYNGYLTGKSITIIQDNDDVGKAFALEIANSLHVACSVKVIDLTRIYSSLPEHGDISDVLGLLGKKGMTEVEQLIAGTPEYAPQEPEKGYICLSDVQPTHTQWLWEPYIPLGKITLLQGDPGAGKTFFTLYLASMVSKGGHFYNEDTCNSHSAAAVVYQTAEDGISDTIVPRLKKMQPDFKNIFCIDETEQGLTLTDERIEAILKGKHPRLFIIDPLQAYLGGDVDMHRANQVRPLMANVGRLAEQYQCAFVLIMHMSKMSGAKALYRGLGSIDFAAAARSVLVIGNNPDDPDEKVMAHEKSSLAKHGESVSFSIDPEKGVVINGTSTLTADDILNPVKYSGNRGGSRDDAMELLAGLLSETGYALKADIEQAANEAGISRATLYRAKQDMELQSLSLGFHGKKTYWMLPTVDREDIPGAEEQATTIEYPGTWPPQ